MPAETSERYRQVGRDWVVTAFVAGAAAEVDQHQAEWFGQFAAVAAEVRLLVDVVLAAGGSLATGPLARAVHLRDLMNRVLWLLRDSHGLSWSGILELYATETRGEVERLAQLIASAARGTLFQGAQAYRSAIDETLAALETHAAAEIVGRHLATVFTWSTLLLPLIHRELVRSQAP